MDRQGLRHHGVFMRLWLAQPLRVFGALLGGVLGGILGVRGTLVIGGCGTLLALLWRSSLR